MDADRRLNQNESDTALRELFRESGRHVAPEGMEARILQRIAVMPAIVRTSEPALIPKWMWFGAGTLMLVCVGLLVAQPNGGSKGMLQRYAPDLPSLPVDVLTSGWFMMAASCGLFLLAADTLLARRTLR